MWQYAFCVTWLRTRVLLELRMRCANRTTVYRWGGGAAVWRVLHYFSRGGPAVSVRATEMMCLYKSVYLLTPVLPCEMGAQSRVSRPVHCKLRNATQHSQVTAAR